jgi:hypothetical protein
MRTPVNTSSLTTILLFLRNFLLRLLNLLKPKPMSHLSSQSVVENPPSESPPTQPQESPSHGSREVNPFDTFRRNIARVANKADEWAGLPMPLPDLKLVVEPNYPWAKLYKAFNECVDELEASGSDEDSDSPQIEPIRSFRLSKYKGHPVTVVVYRVLETGKYQKMFLPPRDNLKLLVNTLGASVAWGAEQESKALTLLGEMISDYAMKCYMMTGTFLELSKRSGVMYLFRRLRPTIAMRPSLHGNGTRCIAALCMHPIAHYEQSWSGAMCPTDDVIAHLALMRGDEHLFWKRSEQHSIDQPEAGL